MEWCYNVREPFGMSQHVIEVSVTPTITSSGPPVVIGALFDHARFYYKPYQCQLASKVVGHGIRSIIVLGTSDIKDVLYIRVEGEFMNRIFHVPTAYNPMNERLK